jgi:hypothetical protein
MGNRLLRFARLALAVAERVVPNRASKFAPLASRRCLVVGESYLTALCPACGAAQGDAAVDRLLTSLHPRAPVRVPIPPAPLTFRPLDGRPPRPVLGDGGERVVPAGWPSLASMTAVPTSTTSPPEPRTLTADHGGARGASDAAAPIHPAASGTAPADARPSAAPEREALAGLVERLPPCPALALPQPVRARHAVERCRAAEPAVLPPPARGQR